MASEDDIPLAELAVMERSKRAAEQAEAELVLHKERLRSILDMHNMIVYEVPADGDCFMSALGTLLGKEPDSIRNDICDYIERNIHDFTEMFDREHILGDLSKLRKKGCWSLDVCDHLPGVAANLFQRPVKIFSSHPDISSIIIMPKGVFSLADTVRDQTLHLAYIAIKGREHYDCCFPKEQILLGIPDDFVEDTCDLLGEINLPSDIDKSVTEVSYTSTPLDRSVEHDEFGNDPTYEPSHESESGESGDELENNTDHERPVDGVNSQTQETNTEEEHAIHDRHADSVEKPTHETNTDEEHDGRSRKRRKSFEHWRCNVRKRARNAGQEYVSTRGTKMPSRSFKFVSCKCKNACQTFSETKRKLVCDMFWGLGQDVSGYTKQRQFILNNIKQVDVTRKTKPKGSASRRSNTITYTLPDLATNELVPVCKGVFLGTLSIDQSMVYGALKNSAHNVVHTDKRGKNISNQLNQSTMDHVKAHIKSFPTVLPHYVRRNSARKYLDAALSLSKMYNLYELDCDEKNINPCCIGTYSNIFKTFNIGFHRPKKDQCTKCRTYDSLNNISEDVKKEHEKHLQNKQGAREARDSDKIRAKTDPLFASFNFDKQAVLNTPQLPHQPVFYKRKLSVYNVTTYDVATKDGHCYTWDESNGGRGSNEIASILYNHLMSYSSVQHVTMFSDTAGGENRNAQVVCMCMYAVQQHPTLLTLTHKFFESGHSEMEADSMHSAISREAQHAEIQVPRDWENIMRLARRNPKPYTVSRLKYDYFIDWKQFAKTLNWTNFKTTDTNTKVRWLHIKLIKYDKNEPGQFRIKYSFSEEEEFQLVCVVKRRSLRNDPPVPLPHMTQKRKISSLKKKDLMDLCKRGIIDEENSRFYETLQDDSIQDRLFVRDVTELSDSDCDSDDNC